MTHRAHSCLAIIPARGGSKGIPRKNIRPLMGKPLVAWTIDAAREAKNISRVVVSTDDPEIGQVSQEYGAEVIWRPANISGDSASSESALLHALEALCCKDVYEPDLLAFLQCTSPMTTASDIDATIDALINHQADSAFSATRFFHFLWRTGADGATGINHDKNTRQRRQDRQPEFLENGAIYIMRTPGFLTARHRFFGKTVIHEMPAKRSLEIDEPDDFLLAEALLSRCEEGITQ